MALVSETRFECPGAKCSKATELHKQEQCVICMTFL